MRSALPFHGVPSPRFKAVARPLLRAWQPASRSQWEGTVRALWDEATHREEWYAAIAVARHRRARRARSGHRWLRTAVRPSSRGRNQPVEAS